MDIVDSVHASTPDVLRPLVARRVGERLEELADTMVERYRLEIHEYAALDSPAALAEVRATTRYNVATLLDALARGVPLEESTLAGLAEVGQRRARQGFPLEAVLRAYHVGTWVAWATFIEELTSLGANLSGEAVSRVLAIASSMIFDFTCEVAQVVTDAFLATTKETAIAGERRRQAAVDELLAGSSKNPPVWRRLVEGTGFILGPAHVVMTIEASPPVALRTGKGAGSPVPGGLIDAMAELRVGEAGPPLVHPKGRRTIVICPVEEGSLANELVEGLSRAIESVLGEDVVLRGVVGLVEDGIGGIATSYAQSVRGLDALDRMGIVRGLYSYAELLPRLLLLDAPLVTQDLQEHVMAPLIAHDKSGGASLLATLTALLRTRTAAMGEVASFLGIHRHTLAARAERIQALTGLCMGTGTERTVLEFGVLAHGLREARSVEGSP